MEFELTMQSETKQPKSKRSFRSHDHLTSFLGANFFLSRDGKSTQFREGHNSILIM